MYCLLLRSRSAWMAKVAVSTTSSWSGSGAPEVEEVYLYAYDSVQMAREGIACYFDFFNDERPHKALGYQTPASFYDGRLAR